MLVKFYTLECYVTAVETHEESLGVRSHCSTPDPDTVVRERIRGGPRLEGCHPERSACNLASTAH